MIINQVYFPYGSTIYILDLKSMEDEIAVSMVKPEHTSSLNSPP